MPVLTARQVAGLAAVDTPRGTTVAEWVAKARQESTFNTDAVSPSGCCVGLWQVNVRANCDLINECRDGSGDQADKIRSGKMVMKSATRNWYVTKAIYARQGWQAWSASGGRPSPSAADREAAANPDYSTAGQGAAAIDPDTGRPYPGGEPGVEEEPFHTAREAVDVLGDTLSAIVEAVGAVGAWLADRHNWVRIALVVGGGAAALAAIGIAIKPQVESTVQSLKPL